MNLIDDFTAEDVTLQADATHDLIPNEMTIVRKMYFNASKTQTTVDLFVQALDGSRVGRRTSDISVRELGFGFRIEFIFPQITDLKGDFNLIAQEIDKYLVPTSEFQARKKTEAAKKDVTIEPGMSEEAVLKVLGEPKRRVAFGAKITLIYADMTIEFVDGKVTDLKVN